MTLINLVSPEQAEGNVKNGYSLFTDMEMPVPLSIQMFSSSPEFMAIQNQSLNYFMTHKTLSFALLAHIRLLVANEENYPYCVNLNQNLLKNFAGLSEEQVSAAMSNIDQATLDEKEKAMLSFVMKVVQDPASTEQQDIDNLHNLGWTDADIFDAVQQGMTMLTVGIVFKAFKISEK